MIQIIILVLGIILDRGSKLWATNLNGKNAINIIPNFLSFDYLENRGAAFGLMQDKQWFLIGITLIIMGLLIFMILKYKNEKTILSYSLTLIISGAIGNLYDRIVYRYVIDFISFHYKDKYFFPTFNVADIMVVVGTFLLAVYIIKGES